MKLQSFDICQLEGCAHMTIYVSMLNLDQNYISMFLPHCEFLESFESLFNYKKPQKNQFSLKYITALIAHIFLIYFTSPTTNVHTLFSVYLGPN